MQSSEKGFYLKYNYASLRFSIIQIRNYHITILGKKNALNSLIQSALGTEGKRYLLCPCHALGTRDTAVTKRSNCGPPAAYIRLVWRRKILGTPSCVPSTIMNILGTRIKTWKITGYSFKEVICFLLPKFNLLEIFSLGTSKRVTAIAAWIWTQLEKQALPTYGFTRARDQQTPRAFLSSQTTGKRRKLQK